MSEADPAASLAEPTAGPIRLSFDRHDQVEVVGDDQDRFYTTVSEAARACRQADRLQAWIKEVKEFLSFLNKWCRQHSETIAACYVAWTEGHFHTIVLTQGEHYRFDFDDRITALNLSALELFPEIPLDAIQIPQGPGMELSSFVNPDRAIQPYGLALTAA